VKDVYTPDLRTHATAHYQQPSDSADEGNLHLIKQVVAHLLAEEPDELLCISQKSPLRDDILCAISDATPIPTAPTYGRKQFTLDALWLIRNMPSVPSSI
jgi:hypothetical protein